MIDPNEIGGWVDACPNPALLITLKNHIDDRLRSLKDSEAAKNLHPQLKRHMPAETQPAPTATAKASAPPVPEAAPAPIQETKEASSVENPYAAFENHDSSVHVPAPERVQP